MDIIFKGRRTDVQERFREHAESKLSKISKLDNRAIRVDVEVSQERNPRLSPQRERVELTIHSRGPVIRAEAAADDRFAALDIALAKLETRLRRAGERRKARRVPHAPSRAAEPAVLGQEPAVAAPEPDLGEEFADEQVDAGEVPIQMEGDGPVVVREKFHAATPMSVSQALQEMELVGHDFYLFRDEGSGRASVVYRRRGYQYGLIRLVENGGGPVPAGVSWNGASATPAHAGGPSAGAAAPGR